MPVLALLGIVSGIVVAGFSITDIITTGAWKDWSWFDWIVNIGFILLSLSPLIGASFNALKALLVGGAINTGTNLLRTRSFSSPAIWS